MNQKKRVLALLLAVMLIVSVISGCGAGKATSEESTKGTTNENTAKSTSEQSTAKQPAEDLAPIELSMWYGIFDNFAHYKAEPTEDVVTDYVFKKTGIKVTKTNANDGVSYEEKLKMNIASGDLPDISALWNWQASQSNDIKDLVAADKVWKITPDMIKQYMPNLWSDMGPFIQTQYVATEDPYNGSFRGVPTSFSGVWDLYKAKYPEAYDALSKLYPAWFGLPRGVLVIRDDIFKKVRPEAYNAQELIDLALKNGKLTEEDLSKGGGYIDSLDDLYTLAKDIKALNMPGIIPMMFQSWWSIVYTMQRLEGADAACINWKTMEYYHWYSEPLVPTYKKINKFFRDGLMSPDQFILKADQLTAKIDSGAVAINANGSADIARLNQLAKDQGKNYSYRPLYINQAPSEYFKGYPNTPVPNIILILGKTGNIKTEEQLIRVLKWIDFQNSAEYFDVASWGPKEAGLYTEENGKRKFKTEVLEKHVLYGINSPGEKDGYYYGLDWCSGGWAPRGHIQVTHPMMMPTYPVISYYPLPVTADSVWTYAENITRNKNGYTNAIDSYEWYIKDNYAPFAELSKDEKYKGLSGLGEKLRNEVYPRLLTAKSDADFDKILKDAQGQYNKANFNDYVKDFIKLQLEWYDKNPQFTRPDKLDIWK